MSYPFDKVLSDELSEMVAGALEYAPDVDEVFIYFSDENGSVTADVFYRQGGVIRSKDSVHTADQSPAQQGRLLDFLMDRVESIADQSDKNHPHPTQGKLVYNVRTGTLDADLSYEPQLVHPDVTQQQIFRDWLDQQR